MLSEFNSLLFYIFSFMGSAYLLGFIRQTQRPNTFFYNIVTCAALAIPILMAGYRTCGTDTLQYIYSYVKTIDYSWEKIFEMISERGEGGHIILTKLLGYFSHPRIYLAVYGFITVFFVYKATTYLKPDSVALVMFLYYLVFFVNSFNGMRQYVAIAISAYSLKFVFERKPISFVLLILLASTFHTSVLLVLPVYFLWQKKGDTISWVLLFPILIILLYAVLNLGSVLDSLSSYETESSQIQRYSSYTDTMDSKNRDLYLNLLTAAIAVFHLPRLRALDKRNGFFVILMVIGTILNICGFTSPYAKRIMLYFCIAEIWVLAEIPKCYKDHHSVWAARILVMLYAIARFTIIAYFLGQSNLIPYIWYLPSWARI